MFFSDSSAFGSAGSMRPQNYGRLAIWSSIYRRHASGGPAGTVPAAQEFTPALGALFVDSWNYDKRFWNDFYVCTGKHVDKEKRPAPFRGRPQFINHVVHETVWGDNHGFFFFDENVEQMD